MVGFSLCCRHRFKHGCRDGVCKMMYICAQVRERKKYFFPFYLPLASFPPKDKWSFHTVNDVTNVGLYLWGRAGSCWLCGWGCWRAGVTRGNCPETLGCDLPDISPRCLSRSPSLWTVSPWGTMERGEERLKGGKTEGLGRMVWK